MKTVIYDTNGRYKYKFKSDEYEISLNSDNRPFLGYLISNISRILQTDLPHHIIKDTKIQQNDNRKTNSKGKRRI